MLNFTRVRPRPLWIRRALDLLYPPVCLVPDCARRGAWVCSTCMQRIRPLPAPGCPRCALPGVRPGLCRRCRAQAPPFDAVHAATGYAPPVDALIHALKYRRREVVAPALALLLARALPEPSYDGLVALPSHASRVSARGVDHTRCLTRALAATLALPHLEGVLRRSRATMSQVGRSARERRANVAGAFAAGPAARRLAGRRVLLIDDVMTTGATASEASLALSRAGAARVTVAVVARALPPSARDD